MRSSGHVRLPVPRQKETVAGGLSCLSPGVRRVRERINLRVAVRMRYLRLSRPRARKKLTLGLRIQFLIFLLFEVLHQVLLSPDSAPSLH